MRVVVTGASGFLGSHLVDAAIKHLPDAEILAFCHYRSDGTTGWCPAHSRVKVIRGDIRDTGHIASIKPTHIINAAALVSVPDSHDRPGAHWETNCTSVASMLMAMKGVRFVQISTSEVFDGKQAPYRDTDPVRPITPYGAAKAAAEQAVRGFGQTVCRVFNMFGPRQFPRAVIPRMVRFALEIAEGQRDIAELYGPVGSRAFLYAPWVAEQIVTQVLKDERPLVQLASSQVVELRSLWESIAGICRIDASKVRWDAPPANANPVACLFGYSSTGYKTRKFMVSELEKTICWHRVNRNYCASGSYQ